MLSNKLKPNNWHLNLTHIPLCLLTAPPLAVTHNTAPQPVWPPANQRLASVVSLYDSGSPWGGAAAASHQTSGPSPSQLDRFRPVLPQGQVVSANTRLLQTVPSENPHCRFSASPLLSGVGKNKMNRLPLVTSGKEIISLFPAALFSLLLHVFKFWCVTILDVFKNIHELYK